MKHTACYQKGYPRPQFVRSEWTDLNGEWKFGFDDETQEADALKGRLPRTIRVPYTYETMMSGIGIAQAHHAVWYSRNIRATRSKRTLLHFEGVDHKAYVYIDGKYVGSHCGAYSRYTVDITRFLGEGESVLTVRCEDDGHPSCVRGKQRWMEESYGCWYVQTTGIWKSVWLECVDGVHLSALKMTPDLTDYTIRFDFEVSEPADDVSVRFDISFGGTFLHTVCATASNRFNSVTCALPSEKLTYQVALWSPSDPALYDVTITVSKGGRIVDEVKSYFALRDYSVKGDKILLNGRPFYARLVLDQGYWKESGLTPPDEEALVSDITLAKEMGFNGARKHQKIEDERYFTTPIFSVLPFGANFRPITGFPMPAPRRLCENGFLSCVRTITIPPFLHGLFLTKAGVCEIFRKTVSREIFQMGCVILQKASII